jgi:hypothetical protein
MLRSVIVAALLGASVLAADQPTISRVFTNRSNVVASIISSSYVDGKCAECGEPNHHLREVRLMTGYDMIFTEVVFNAKTNVLQVGTGVATNWISTNLLFRPNRTPPPLPIAVTNQNSFSRSIQ